MKAQIVIDHYLEKYQKFPNTFTDINFDYLPFLYPKDPAYNMKGIKVLNHILIYNIINLLKIKKVKTNTDFIYNNITYPNLFV